MRLPNNSSARALTGFGSTAMRGQVGRVLAGEGVGDDPGQPAGLEDLGDLGLDAGAVLAGFAAGESLGQLGQTPAGAGDGLVEPPGLVWRAAWPNG